MRSTAIERRTLLSLLGAAALYPAGTEAEPACPEAGYVSAARRANGDHAAILGRSGTMPRTAIALPGRGHEIAASPDRRLLVAVSRRPGRWFAVRRSDGDIHLIEAAAGRHFYGHGAFSADGRWFFASENAYDSATGMIGRYDVAAGFVRRGEWTSGGVGPHALARLPGGEDLVVANGGIETHPDTGRTPLNLPDMRPSLAVLRLSDGAVVWRAMLEEHWRKLSVRHLSVRADGLIAVGLQDRQGGRHGPVLALATSGGSITLLPGDEVRRREMRGYCGALAFDRSGRWLAATSPRGNCLQLWRTDERCHHASLFAPDLCGVAPAGRAGRFLVSSGEGRLYLADAATAGLRECQRIDGGFDNHLTPLSI